MISFDGSFFKESMSLFVLVIVDEVCDVDVEKGGVDIGVEVGDIFMGDDVLNGFNEFGFGFFGFDLSVSG